MTSSGRHDSVLIRNWDSRVCFSCKVTVIYIYFTYFDNKGISARVILYDRAKQAPAYTHARDKDGAENQIQDLVEQI